MFKRGRGTRGVLPRALFLEVRREAQFIMTTSKTVTICAALLTTGLALRAVLPHSKGLFLLRGKIAYIVPYNKLAFWVCVGAGIAIALSAMARVMTRDLGLR